METFIIRMIDKFLGIWCNFMILKIYKKSKEIKLEIKISILCEGNEI